MEGGRERERVGGRTEGNRMAGLQGIWTEDLQGVWSLRAYKEFGACGVDMRLILVASYGRRVCVVGCARSVERLRDDLLW